MYNKGVDMQVDKQFLTFIKSQLKAIQNSSEVDISAGIASSVIAFMDHYGPSDMLKVYVKPLNGQLIQSIKHVREFTGMGLKEAKDVVEQNLLVFQSEDVAKIQEFKKLISHCATVSVKGNGTAAVLFGDAE